MRDAAPDSVVDMVDLSGRRMRSCSLESGRLVYCFGFDVNLLLLGANARRYLRQTGSTNTFEGESDSG